jgi:hypothetical protein
MMHKKLPASRAVMMTVAALVLVALTLANSATTKAAKKITLVYVGAENCAPCDSWQRNQSIAFRNSAEFQRLAYREVKSPNLFSVLHDDYWPEDLRLYRQAISQGAGVPLWLVIADDQLVMHRAGLSQWQESVFPKIKSLTAAMR